MTQSTSFLTIVGQDTSPRHCQHAHPHGFPSSQIRMAVKEHSVHVPYLPLVPVGPSVHSN